jgi:hypothetical protein
VSHLDIPSEVEELSINSSVFNNIVGASLKTGSKKNLNLKKA